MYVEKDDGQRIPCRHPIEDSDIQQVLGCSFHDIGLSVWGVSEFGENGKWWWSRKKKSTFKLIRQKTGYNSFCICSDCLSQFTSDLGDEESEWRSAYGFCREKDERLCKKCLSKNVKTVFELIGHTCPKCKQGKIEEIVTGMVS